jgi:hypothetical protein
LLAIDGDSLLLEATHETSDSVAGRKRAAIHCESDDLLFLPCLRTQETAKIMLDAK